MDFKEILNSIKSKDILYIIGIGATFILSVINLYFVIKNNKKTTFVNSITTARLKYVQDIRNSISKFCGLVYILKSNHENSTTNEDNNDKELLTQVAEIKCLINLYLNPEDEDWDCKTMKLIDEVLKLSGEEQTIKINELIIHAKYSLKIEWEGAKLESKNGFVSKRKMKKLKIDIKEKRNKKIDELSKANQSESPD